MVEKVLESDILRWAVCFLCLAFSALFLSLKIKVQQKYRNMKAARIGIDPGFLNFRLAAAKSDFFKNASDIVGSAYRQSKRQNYLVQTQDMERLILAPYLLSEVGRLPNDKLSHTASIIDRYVGKYNNIDIVLSTDLHVNACLIHLNQNLDHFLPVMVDELKFARREYLAQYNLGNSYTLPTYQFVYTMISRMTSRVLLGLPLCRSEDWQSIISTYVADVHKVSTDLQTVPHIFRPIVAPFLKSIKRVQSHQKAATDLLYPSFSNRGLSTDVKTVLEWMLVEADQQKLKPRDIILTVLMLTMAAFHTTTMATVHALYDLCANPKYHQSLKQEIDETFDDRVANTHTMERLEYLDSFLKESQRINQPSILGFNRKVLSPIRLSDGTNLSPGLFVNLPSEAMSIDTEYYADPETFDATRFLKREPVKGMHDQKKRFSSINPGNLAWGSGRVTCPGRRYASVQIKLLLANILRDFEIKFPGTQTERPANTYRNDSIAPNKDQEIMLQKVVAADDP